MNRIDEIKIENFAPDDSFFDDLRLGNFCLVLGAGFSYNIKNNTKPGDLPNEMDIPYNDHKSIPLATDYTRLTNQIFKENKNVNDYRAAAGLWEANRFCIDKVGLSGFYKNLFTPDEAAFLSDNFNDYRKLLIPSWHGIYTFNFDTVFETIVSLAGKKEFFYSVFYPENKGVLPKDKRTAISHLHGIITNEELENLVFSYDGYSKLRETRHSLYDTLHNDVNEGKKLFIIGTQFNEDCIDDKFFTSLKENITIYHFDKANNDFIAKKQIYDNPNYHFIEIKDIYDVLSFIQKNKAKIENIEIDGAELINKEFIDNIVKCGEEKKYSADDFYLAKQYKDCQWYGIHKGWDIKRNAYDVIKNEVRDAIRDLNREPKIAASIIGRGGSGKSTLLRRLAIDCAKEDYSVIWVNDKEIDKFRENGIEQIDNYPDKMFLVIIEDWYRIKQNLKESASETINDICACRNVRLVIGDRTTDSSISKEHYYNPVKNRFVLEINENRKTIADILQNVPDWVNTAERLLQTEEDYNSSLYLILWAIGRTYHLENAGKIVTNIGIGNLIGHFQSIVESDLRAIAKHYPGLAKALYYWARIYKHNKLYIKFDLFEIIANSFNNENAPFKYVQLPGEIKAIIDIYINRTTKILRTGEELIIISFNHDILAEEGLALCELENKIENCLPFGDNIKLEILRTILEDGDDFSSSIFLNYVLATINKKTLTGKEKLTYINDLYSKGNRGIYLNHLFYKNDILNWSEKLKYADKILKDLRQNEYKCSTTCLCLRQLANTEKGKAYSIEILKKNMVEKIPAAIICRCFEIVKETTDGVAFAREILKRKDVEHKKDMANIICSCLEILKEKGEAFSFAKDILKKNEFVNISAVIICRCLEIAGNSTIGTNYAKRLLKRSEQEVIHPDIICNCLEILKATKEGIEFAEKALKKYGTEKVDSSIICRCLGIVGNSPEGMNYAKLLLKRSEQEVINNDIICNCLEILKFTEEGKEFAEKILTKNENEKIGREIICHCLEMLKDTKIGLAFAEKILVKNETDNIEKEILCRCIEMLGGTEKGIAFAENILIKYETDKTDSQIVCTCLFMLKDTDGGKTFAKKILLNNGKDKVENEIICACINVLNDSPEGIEYAIKILSNIGKEIENHQIICNCLKVLRDTPEGIRYAGNFLKEKEWKKKWSITFQALNCFTSSANPPGYVIEIVTAVIDEFYDHSNLEKGKYFRFINIMKIPFHNILKWKYTSKEILLNLNSDSSRSVLASILLSYRRHPAEIKKVCEYILNNWVSEITIPVWLGKDKEKQYGNNVAIALGHPALKELSLKCARQIKEAEESKKGTIPVKLLEIVNKTVSEGIPPVWQTEK